MASQIDYRSASTFPADEVFATTVDPDFIRARLAQIGGPGAALVNHAAAAGGVRYTIRHGLDAKDLPSIVRGMLPNPLVIERTESWKPLDAGGYGGETSVSIPSTPASAAGAMRLRDVTAGGSDFLVRATVTVNVPLFGGRVESIVAEQVQNLLAAEAAFMQEWLTSRS
ncbi:DUF2505 domain-containing protein [Pseudonocardia sp. GCM10023141]|uniref:DUF2505 domain-containing protein n=1 Tax=Pseudonocardia sp. GCM10023141 TaxID=3252653 RepID=UPI003610043F